MKNLLAIPGSNSVESINKKFVTWASTQLSDVKTEVLDLNDYEMPIYSIDTEKQQGIPKLAQEFKSKIEMSDGILISFAEHNGNFAAALKNITDWVSRLEGKTWANKKMFIMATSPGGRGGKGVLGIAENLFPHQGAEVLAKFSLPFFSKNFSAQGIADEELSGEFNNQLELFNKGLKENPIEESEAF